MTVRRPESTVLVRPFVRSYEGDEVVIGDPQRGTYLAVPPEAVELLDDLAAGQTVGETVRRYEQRHGETPDLDDFLDVLTAEGFVRHTDDSAGRPREPHQHRRSPRRVRTVSLNWIPRSIARPLVSAPAVTLYALTILTAFVLYLREPSVLPGTSVVMFPHGSFALLATITAIICLLGSFVHELAHAVVARAAGVPVTLGLGNLMYTIVAQTNITGMRTAPKRQMYLAFLAGTIADLVSASLLFFVLDADRRGLLTLPVNLRDMTGAVVLGYLFRSSSQLQFYVRTDLYYVVAAAFNCRSLLSDTETRLRNGVLRLFGKRRPRLDMSRFSRRERAGIRVYTLFYLIGRAYAILILLFVFLPIQARVLAEFLTYRSGEYTHLKFIDFLLIAVLTTVFYGGGLFVWLRGLYRSITRRTSPTESTEPAQPVTVGS